MLNVRVLLEEIDNLKTAGRGRKGNGLASAHHHNNIGGAESDSEMSISESVTSDAKQHHSRSRNTAAAPRKKRDPNAPKGPGNVFFLYCRMERDNIKDEVPNESLGEVTRLLGQKWKALTKDQKQKYYDLYKKEQEEYETAMKSYTAAGGGVEGAAAVEAAAHKRHEEELEDSNSQLQMDDEEIDMLQDDDDIDEVEDDEEDMIDEDGHPSIPIHKNMHQLGVPHSPSSIATDHSTPMPETPQNSTHTTTTF